MIRNKEIREALHLLTAKIEPLYPLLMDMQSWQQKNSEAQTQIIGSLHAISRLCEGIASHVEELQTSLIQELKTSAELYSDLLRITPLPPDLNPLPAQEGTKVESD